MAESSVQELPCGKVLRRVEKQGTVSGGSCDNPARLNEAYQRGGGMGSGEKRLRIQSK